MAGYEHSNLVDSPPHIYALVEGAYRKAVRGGGSQSLIISGESGAGKTESTKLALSYLVWRTREHGAGASGRSALTTSIIQANPLMEAFGNASTSRNSNSSRFGKCVRLGINADGGNLLGGQVIAISTDLPTSLHISPHASPRRTCLICLASSLTGLHVFAGEEPCGRLLQGGASAASHLLPSPIPFHGLPRPSMTFHDLPCSAVSKGVRPPPALSRVIC